MSIGETLAKARRDAGLSMAEVSRRTGIKLSVIDDIEHDDYAACGGDRRARGTIAAIAQAVGVDAGPLIEAYAGRGPADSGWIAATEPSEPIGAMEAAEAEAPAEPAEAEAAAEAEAEAPEVFTPLAGPELVTAEEDTQPIRMGQPPEPVTTGESADPVTLADTALPAGAFGPVRLALADRRPVIWIALGGALLAVAALGGILLITGANGQRTRPAVVAERHHNGSRGATHPASKPPTGHSARRSRQARSASRASGRHAQALVPASIEAFGPGGTGQGDSPQLAHQALAGKAAAPWHSAWYATAHFGNLQAGTGLLLDMGRPVTITSARIALGSRPGTDLALRIGNSPALASLPPAAHANDAAGMVRLKTAPTRGRYVLVWFTRLPPDQAGTYQVSVYDIKLRGRP